MLSKSRLMRGIQCAKALYLTVHHRELEAPAGSAQQALFDQGHEVGLAAQKSFPAGVTITAPPFDSKLAIAQTEEAIRKGANTLYEATFESNGVSARIDILHRPNSDQPWKIIEVKSSTGVKQEHLTDVAIQSLAMSGTPHVHEETDLMHINSETVAPRLENIFIRVPVTSEVEKIKKNLPAKISVLENMLLQPEPPAIDIGPQCDYPYECPFKAHCWKHIPSQSIFEIPAIGKKAWELYTQGIVEIADPRYIPAPLQIRRIAAVRTNKRWIDPAAIETALKNWGWPRYYLDFETIHYAIPRYVGTHPYEQVPFQFSCLVEKKPGEEVKEFFYLHDAPSDPRPNLITELIAALGTSGPIVAYNMAFEGGCLERLATFSPAHANDLLAAKARLVDPLPIFRAAVYDPAFRGSFSIKSVSPGIFGADRTYKGMRISHGGEAQQGFMRLISEDMPAAEKFGLRTAMLEYCRKDTTEMRDLVGWLESQVPQL